MLSDALAASARYHAWANDRILSLAAAIPDEDLRAPTALDHGTAFATLRHLVDVDWSWRQFVIGNDVGEAYVWDLGHPMDDLAAVHAFSVEEDATLERYIGTLDERAISEELAISEDFVRPRWLVLAHLLNHGTQHRTEMARFLTDRGHSPGELDLLDAFDLG